MHLGGIHLAVATFTLIVGLSRVFTASADERPTFVQVRCERFKGMVDIVVVHNLPHGIDAKDFHSLDDVASGDFRGSCYIGHSAVITLGAFKGHGSPKGDTIYIEVNDKRIFSRSVVFDANKWEATIADTDDKIRDLRYCATGFDPQHPESTVTDEAKSCETYPFINGSFQTTVP